jgi:hypothetical protein
MVPKPDGSRRMCVDFCNLNDCTEDASFPIPHTKQMFSRIGAQKPKYFGTMDLTQGYQVRVRVRVEWTKESLEAFESIKTEVASALLCIS